MVSLETTDNALKSFYLDAITKEIDDKGSVFLSMIEKTSANVTGKDVKKIIKTGLHTAVGAGSETGDLPYGDSNSPIVLTAPLKNIYGTIEISDKAIRASGNNEGAFVNLLNDEMDTLIKSAKYQLGRMLFGDSTGKLATVVRVSGNNIQIKDAVALQAGMYVDLWSADDELIKNNCRIMSINNSKTEIQVSAPGSGVFTDVEPGWSFRVCGVEDNSELTGLAAIFSDNDIYGVDRSMQYMRPYVRDNVGEIDEETLQACMDEIEEASGSPVNVMICSWGVRRALIRAFKERNYPVTMIKIGENASTLSFNGIPVVVDRFCPQGTLYMLNTNDFKLCQLGDWEWMQGEDSKILKQIAGRPLYTATLVKYAELLCLKPCGQGVLRNIEEA